MTRLKLKIFWLVNILAFSGDFLILNTGYHAILQVIQLLLQIYLLLKWATVRSSKRLFVYTLHLYINHESYNYSVCF